MPKNMTKDEHRKRHQELHQRLDELVADYVSKTGKRPSEVTVMDLIQWSHNQTINPDEIDKL